MRGIVVAWILWLAAPPLWAQSDGGSSEEAYRLNQTAIEHLNREEFEKAIVLLQRARRLLPENETIRNNLAQVHFRLGARLQRAKTYEGARDQFQAAIALNDEESQYHLFLGSSLYSLGQYSGAREALQKAIRIDPQRSAAAHENLGHVAYKEGQPEEAIREWETALRLDSTRTELLALLERARREASVEGTFLESSGSHFEVRYDGKLDPELIDRVRGHLESAYYKVGNDLFHYPTRTVEVVLYSRGDFSEVTGGHRWVGGLFDGKKIRVPLDRMTTRPAELERILVHEYTHFVIDALAPDCPSWLHEGIAQWAEGRRTADVRDRLLNALDRRALVPIHGMTESFAKTEDPAVASLQYAETLAFVDYLTDRFGPQIVPELLRSLAQKGSVDEALTAVVGLGIRDLEKSWEDSLEGMR